MVVIVAGTAPATSDSLPTPRPPSPRKPRAMSSSPDGHSAGSNTPTSDVAPTSNTTATSGFTAVNGRRSPTGSDAHINGLVKMDTSADAASRYDTVRVAGTSLSASPADEPGHLALNSPGKRKRSDGERRDPTTGMEQGTGTYASSTSTGASVSASASAGAGAAAPPDTRRTPPQVWSDSPAQGMQRAPNHQPAYGPADNDPKDSQGWYSATAHRQQRAESPNADARLAEALQRDNSQSVDARHLHHDEAQVMDHIGGTPQHQITSTTETTAAGVQVDPKKRKRVSVHLSTSQTAVSASLANGRATDLQQPHEDGLSDVSQAQEEVRRGQAGV